MSDLHKGPPECDPLQKHWIVGEMKTTGFVTYIEEGEPAQVLFDDASQAREEAERLARKFLGRFFQVMSTTVVHYLDKEARYHQATPIVGA